MKIEHDTTNDASYIYLCSCTVSSTKEVPGQVGRTVMLDIAEDSHVIGVEILGIKDQNDALNAKTVSDIHDILRNRETHHTRIYNKA